MASSRGLTRRATIREHFSELPQPGKAPAIETTVSDKHLKALEAYIDALSNHILGIQEKELAITKDFSEALKKTKEEAKEKKDKKHDLIAATDSARNVYVKSITEVREKRKLYREMLYDALQERKKLWDSMQIQKEEDELLKKKISKLHALAETQQIEVVRKGAVLDAFAILYLLMQIGLIFLFSTTTEFLSSPAVADLVGTTYRSANFYTFYGNIALMVFIGFGYLGSSLKKNGFNSIGYTFCIACFAFQWSFLTEGFFWAERLQRDGYEFGVKGGWQKIGLTVDHLIWGLYGATATIVGLSASIGKLKPVQQLLFTAIFIPFFSLNHWIGYHHLYALDLGGSIFIFTFGSAFGIFFSLAFSRKQSPSKDSENNTTSYDSELFGMFGTLFLWIMWPGFNAALAPDTTQDRVIVNTVLALCTSCIFTFIFSRRSRGGKFFMGDIQRASLAGGIALGSVTSYVVSPGAAMVTGAVAGATSTLSLVYLQPVLQKKINLYDPFGVFSFYLVPGVIGAFAGILAAGVASDYTNIYGVPTDTLFSNHGAAQAGWNFLVLIISIAIAIAVGGLLGVLLSFLTDEEKHYFTDELEWEVPADFEGQVEFPEPTSEKKKGKN